MRQSTVRRVSFGLAAILTSTLLAVQEPAAAAPRPNGTPKAPKETPLPVRDVPSRVTDLVRPDVRPAVPRQVDWPSAGEATVELTGGAAKAGSLPVTVARTRADSRPFTVRMKLLPQSQANRLGLTGVVLRLDRAGAGRDEVEVAVDTATFAGAVGGGWADRLHLVRLPACALETPDVAACRQPTALPGSRAGTARVARATVAVEQAPAVLALVAGASGSSGSYTATPLSPSSTWSAGSQSGSFSWSYPLRVPPGLNGPSPQLTVAYDSGSVDGRTASTNAQPTWLGEGFDLPIGYVERNYASCQEDQSGGNNSVKTGDLCWKTDTVNLALGGHSGEVIRDASTGKYKLVNDDGSRIELLTGAAGSPDDNGEHWKLTTSDGTQYFFGTTAAATWTVPVAGNQPGEPCRATTFTASFCDQAWRWNVDRVVDVHGNTMNYGWARETNRYQRQAAMSGDARSAAYTAGGHLTKITYGTRSGAESSPAPAQVVFTTAERCLPDDNFDCAPAKLTSANAARWPDVPFDQICTSTTSCGTNGSPAFFTRKRLTSVATQILSAANQPVTIEQWDFAQDFYDPADGSSGGLQLKGITHTGRYGATTPMPAITFAYEMYRNRVTGLIDGPVMWKPRLTLIRNETGGEISPVYDTTVGAGRLCSSSTLPSSPATNTTRCYPSYWTPVGATNPTLTWFYKYVVTQVGEKDLVGGAVDTVTSITYVGGAAWRYDDSEITPARHRTWSGWRGYGKVEVRRGDASTPKSLTTTTYLRGMDGNRAADGSTVPPVNVTDSKNGETLDADRVAGTPLETEIFNGSERISTTISKPWISAPTATSGSKTATLVGPGVTDDYTAIFGGGERHTRTTTTTDPVYGTATRVDDRGDTSTTADDMCSQYSYARNTTAWITSAGSEEKQYASACAGTMNEATLVAHSRTLYDGGAFGAAPSRGLITETQALGDSGFVTRSKAGYDAYARVTSTTDAMNRVTRTAYTHLAVTGQTHTGGTVGVTTTDPLNNEATTEVSPAWGVPVKETDINDRVTSLGYDGLGRLTAVWTPSRPKGTYPNTPSMKFGYSVTKSAPSHVWSQEIVAASVEPPTYRTKYEIFDGLLRPRQTQVPEATTGGGRIVSDSEYNSRGLAVRTGGPYYATGAPGGGLVQLTDVQKSAWHQISYDQADRPTLDVFMSAGVEKYRTSTSYGGSFISIDPPDGQQPTTTWTDGRGRTTSLWRYQSNSPNSAGGFDETKYSYDPLGRLTQVTGPSGAKWDYGYDKRGRLVRTDDPDKGVVTSTYNDNDQVVTSTDARGQTVWTGYDALGRLTETRRADSGGALLTSRTYDTVTDAKGKPASTTRYVNGQAYTQRITGYDEAYRPTGGELVIPAAEGALQGTYETANAYGGNGSLATVDLPPVPQAGIGAEQLRIGYDEQLGGMASLASTAAGSIVGGVIRSSYGEGLIYGLGRADATIFLGYAYEEGTRRLAGQTAQRQTASGYDVNLSYAYDKGGNITSVTDSPSVSGTSAEKQCYSYDAAAQLTGAWTPATNVVCTTAPDRAALAGPAPYWHGYTYDSGGNRKTETIYSSWGDTSRVYTYPAVSATGKGQPHTLTKLVNTPLSGGATTSAYTYDLAGNTKTRTTTGASTGNQSFTWDDEGRVSAATTNGTSSSYVYDADGERLIRTEGTVKTLYLDNTEVQLNTTTGVVSATRYYEFDGRTVAMRQSGGPVRALLVDNNGSPIWSADFTTTSDLKRRRYYPFGAERTGFTPVVWPGERGYVGGVKDAATGLTHLGAREYDPATGRFLSVDPIMRPTAPATFNPYVYSQNSPITLSDPTGLEPGSWCRTPSCTQHDEAMRAGKAKPCAGTCYNNDEPATARKAAVEAAQRNLNAARQRSVEVKKKLVETAKKLGKVLMDELGITAGLDCVTKGDLGACAETAINALMSAVSGFAAKLVAKYAFRWGKAAKLGKLLWKLGGDLVSGIKGFFKAKADIGRASAMLGRVTNLFKKSDSCAVNSFTGDTPVLMANGRTKPIKAVQLGDQVVATDARTGRTATRPVTRLIRHGGVHRMVAVTVQGGATLRATDQHPFWETTSRTYRYAEDLRTGDRLQTSAGTTVPVTALSEYVQDLTAYNLTVADIHTYYVLAGRAPVLVHNCGDAAKHSVDNLTDALDENTFFHYTDEAGHASIMEGGVVTANSKNAAYFTQEIVAPSEANNALFAGVPDYAGRGSHVIAFRMPPGALQRATQRNEMAHLGSFRFSPDQVIFHGPNPFE
ncbi:polymorphic toxin-type HINT domain-containing protein [Actinoplanes sp. NPDC051861]|uniref:polymorphic toxin-type HINT domain-containing protein n=1 Tax=Actinoplanes sp. NPDC051861 TaxID=3155170 RepID=UPI0034140964